MSNLRELYQDMIVDHGRRPRNFGPCDDASHCKQGFNPLCGDELKLYLKIDNDIIHKAKFEGCGCAISMASASLMTEYLKNKSVKEAQTIFDQFHQLVTTGQCDADLGKLEALAGVNEFPARVKCATLAWQTLNAAILQQDGVVSTE